MIIATSTKVDKVEEIKRLIKVAEQNLSQAQWLAIDCGTEDTFYFCTPTYGVGGYLHNGQWSALGTLS